MIFISAGHYENSKGAIYEDIFNEFDEAVLWQHLIFSHLKIPGVEVPHGRLVNKIKFINTTLKSIKDEKNIAVEIHFNSAKKIVNRDKYDRPIYKHVGRGSETLYCPNSIKGRKAAIHVQGALKNVFGPSRGVREGWYQMNPKKGPDAFLKRTKCTAIIIEPEFVQNYEKIAEGREAGCTVIANTLMQYIRG